MKHLCDELCIKVKVYKLRLLIPYSIERDWVKRQLPVVKVRKYIMTKAWSKDVNKAIKCYIYFKNSGKYDKVKLHKNCVYLIRRL